MTENTLFTERAIFLFGKLSAIHQSEAVAIAGNALLGELSLWVSERAALFVPALALVDPVTAELGLVVASWVSRHWHERNYWLYRRILLLISGVGQRRVVSTFLILVPLKHEAFRWPKVDVSVGRCLLLLAWREWWCEDFAVHGKLYRSSHGRWLKLIDLAYFFLAHGRKLLIECWFLRRKWHNLRIVLPEISRHVGRALNFLS